MMHTYTHLTNVCTKRQPYTPYGIKEINSDKILKLMVTTARSKVKSRSHHDIAHLHPLTNVPTKYQLSTSYKTRFSNSRSLWQGQRSNQGPP